MRIELERAGDVEDAATVRAVVDAAFGVSQRVGELVDQVRGCPEFRPELSVVARSDAGLDVGESVIGYVLVSDAAVVSPDGTRRRVASLSPLAVSPEWQGHGVGSALVREVLTRAELLGEGLVVLQGSPRFYPRFGFQPSAEVGVTMTLPDWAPAEAAMACRLASYDESVRGQVELPWPFQVIEG